MAKPKIRNEIRFLLNGEDVALADVAPDETLLDYLGCAARCAAPRKAAPRATAAPAPCWSAGCRGGKLVYETRQRLHPLRRLARRLPCRHGRASRRRDGGAASGAAGDGRFPRLAMRLLHAGLRHVALWPVDGERRRRPTPRSRRRCRAISAAAPATSRSCGRRMAISSYGKAAKDPLAVERKAITAQACGAARRQRASRSATGKQRLIVPAIARRSRRRCSQPSRRRTIVAGSTDVGLWVTKFMRDISPADLHRRARRAADDLRGRRRHHASAPASPTPRRSRRSSKRIPAARAAVRPHRRRAGAQHGHDRRQHRQRLADRRHAAAADRARRHADAAQGQASAATMPLEDFFIAYGKQDRQPGEFVESGRRAACRRRARISPSTRSPSAATRTSPPRSAPSI